MAELPSQSTPDPEATRLRQDIAAMRERHRRELSEASSKARDEAALALVELIDDCDRAIEIMYTTSDLARILDGVEKLRERALHRFQAVGIQPFGRVGEMFDPNIHEAIATEPGPGADGTIVRVHQRGWHRAGTLISTAKVVVRKGGSKGLTLQDQVVRRRQASEAVEGEAYHCPYGVSGCQGDCPSCRLVNSQRKAGG